ncbi:MULTISPECIES: protein YhfH [Bacillaceae]|uniref:Protein YhfH n=1 Tax=Ectobacillus funiculus TaxID=137993 RepID=A0ABV5WL14_9BACI|nr:protein YhfH [Ectobacillus funiculus]
MIQKPLEFFRNLPSKKCCECGREIEELHEVYQNKCDDCTHTTAE